MNSKGSQGRGDMLGPLWGSCYSWKDFRGKVLCGEAHADALGQEAEGSQGHVLLT